MQWERKARVFACPAIAGRLIAPARLLHRRRRILPSSPPQAGATASPVPTFVPKLSGKALADALRSGGYALVIRHGLTDPSVSTIRRQTRVTALASATSTRLGASRLGLLAVASRASAFPMPSFLLALIAAPATPPGLAFGNYDPAFELTAFNNTDPTTNINAFQALISRKPQPGPKLYLRDPRNKHRCRRPSHGGRRDNNRHPTRGWYTFTPVAIVPPRETGRASWVSLSYCRNRGFRESGLENLHRVPREGPRR